MGTESGPIVEPGGIVLRPTSVLLWVVVGAIGLVALIGERPVALGPVLAIAGLAAFDAGLSARALRNRLFSASLDSPPVSSQQPFVVTVVAPSGADILLRPVGLGFDEPPGPDDWLVLPGDTTVAEVCFPDGRTGVGSALRWITSVSIFGFVMASRVDTFRTGIPLRRGPDPLVCAVPPMGRDSRSQLREYRPGDRPSSVSWSATARTGQLHVLDAADDGDEEVIVVVELAGPTEIALAQPLVDAVLGQAAHLLNTLIEQGSTVVVRTHGVSLATMRSGTTEHWQAGSSPEAAAAVIAGLHDALVTDRQGVAQRLALTAAGTVERPNTPYLLVSATGVEVVA